MVMKFSRLAALLPSISRSEPLPGALALTRAEPRCRASAGGVKGFAHPVERAVIRRGRPARWLQACYVPNFTARNTPP
jgi:hypothetical protein